MLSQADHGYWLPMNAFLLLRPMYEDRKYRMKTRFIGTAAGCVAISLLLPFFHGTSGHFFLAAVMVVGMYNGHSRYPDPWSFCYLFCPVYEYSGYERNPGY